MQNRTARARSAGDTRERILDAALEALGDNPDLGMGDIASAAGVVRRTVYGYFPTRTDLVRTLAQRAADEVEAVLDEANDADGSAERVWVDFIARLWPVMHRYRVLLSIRRGEHGDEIHALLEPVDETLADLVRRGQGSGVFGLHLPAHVLSQVAFAAVFAIADRSRLGESLGPSAAAMTSLLVLGVPESRAGELVDIQEW
jgi:AcrR family transcriptional regulator